ncbi:MAG: hypothetical protein WC529_04100 [Candidatus Margulisiibacteriota bacterium]
MARTIEGFRREMSRSILNFYARRGLSGPDLFIFARKLQDQVTQLRGQNASKDDIKKALAGQQAGLMEFPRPFNPQPLQDESFLVVKKGGLIEREASLSPERRIKYVSELLGGVYTALVNGTIASEGHYAGLGTRLESPKPKFTMTPADLLACLKKFADRSAEPQFRDDPTYVTLREQLAEQGGLPSVLTKFAGLHDWTIGERIFLAKIHDIYQIASTKFGVTPESFRRILQSLKFKIIVNEQSGGVIIENFIKGRFFGLNPENVIFMYQAQHPTWEVAENGGLRPDAANMSQGNHGLLPFQSNLEGQWFRVIPDSAPRGYREERITTTDYKDFQANVTTLVVESVEDTSQYVQPYDYTYLAYVEKLGREQGVQMFMKIVGQKEKNPQKGGFLAAVTQPDNAVANAVLESNRAPALKPRDITNLNLNRNAFFNPNAVDDAIMESGMIEDLHPTIEPQGKELLVRIDPKVPQGDRNLYLRTRFIKDDPPASISNLKDPVDILPTLLLMRRMEDNPEVVKFAEYIGLLQSAGGAIFIERPFKPTLPRLAEDARSADQPLSLALFNDPVYLNALSVTAREHLQALFEVAEVTGSLVREYEIAPDNTVYLRTLPATMKGAAAGYQTNSLERTIASDSKAYIARDGGKIFIGRRHDFDVIDLPNKQSARGGEIVTLTLNFKAVAPARIAELFAGKFQRVLEQIADTGISNHHNQVIDYLTGLPIRDVLFNNSSRLADMVVERFFQA